MRHVVVVSGNAVDDEGIFPILGRDLDAELHVGALVVVGQHLADVVQQAAPLGELDIEVEFRRHHPGNPGDFLRVLVDVLPVGRPIPHPPDQLDHFGMEPVDARLVGRLLAQFDQLLLQLLLDLFDDLFDPPGMNPPVGNQRFERAPSDFAANRVEA